MNIRSCLLLLILVAWLAQSPVTAASEVQTRVTFLRPDHHHWQARYRFSRPIDAFRVYPANLSFRNDWSLPAGYELNELENGAEIQHADGPFDELVVSFRPSSSFTDKTYVPVLPFSDGGVAIYSGHFSGDVMVDGSISASATTFSVENVQDAHVVLPMWTSERRPAYIYVGQHQPVQSQQAQLIADPALPAWLLDVFHQAVPLVTGYIAGRLDQSLETSPIVLIAAGELHDHAGYSVKGGGLYNQYTIMLRGTDLLTPSRHQARDFQKMIAHELVHVWQEAIPGGAGNDHQPWLHEGSADAMAVAALQATGLWSDDEVHRFTIAQVNHCQQNLETSLSALMENGRWDAIYSCGLREFNPGHHDPFELWLRLAEAAHMAGTPYTQEMLEAVRSNR